MSYFARSNELPAWVRTLPQDWGSDWLKWSATLSAERPSAEEQGCLPYISNESISSWTGNLLKEDPQSSESDGRKFRVDDVLLNKLRPYLAKVYHAEFDGVSSGELLCLRPSDTVLPRFLFYVLVSKGFIDSINAETFGSKMPRADWEIVGHQPLPLPPLETQQRIARFLDEKTAWIDALIEKKRALLDRLTEKRQTLITHAVTKGLNPDVPMKPSGIGWLGDIPAHWELLPLKRLVEDAVGLQMGPFGGMLTNLPEYETGFKLYGQENTISGDFSRGNRWIDKNRFEDLKRYELIEGDLVITRKGSLGSCRRVPANVLPGIADSDTIRIRPDQAVLLSSWALLLLHEAVFVSEQISVERRGAILSGLNTSVVGALMLTVPPVSEQSQIIENITKSTAPVDITIEKMRLTIIMLKEYRTALITAAVTGRFAELN